MSAEVMKVWDDIVEAGELLPFFGVDGHRFKLGAMALEAIEDESDGYRSYLETLAVPTEGCIFFPNPVAHVRARKIEGADERESPWRDWYGEFIGWGLFDESGHRWLLVGTENNDDYYPSFRFHYTPVTP